MCAQLPQCGGEAGQVDGQVARGVEEVPREKAVGTEVAGVAGVV